MGGFDYADGGFDNARDGFYGGLDDALADRDTGWQATEQQVCFSVIEHTAVCSVGAW